MIPFTDFDPSSRAIVVINWSFGMQIYDLRTNEMAEVYNSSLLVEVWQNEFDCDSC